MKTMYVYLIKNMPGREFMHALKKLDDVECFISWKYQKELNIRPVKEILVVEANSLQMLGIIVKELKRFIEKVAYMSPGFVTGYPGEETYKSVEQDYLNNILIGADDNAEV